MWNEAIMAYPKCYPAIYLEELRKYMGNLMVADLPMRFIQESLEHQAEF
jgi:hypothetical protein